MNPESSFVEPPVGRIFLSPPTVTPLDVEAVVNALNSGWVSPLGPDIAGFEADMAAFVGVRHAVALSSGTAALHLGLLALGVGSGDQVIVPTLTFGATAFAVTYTGAEPIFVDVEELSWNLDPNLLSEVLARLAARNRLPAAIISVDLFGRPANIAAIRAIADEYGIPVLCDAAEALGARTGDHMCGSAGHASVLSFNGNKIMTTSGGGMFLSDDFGLADRVRFWATQSREKKPWYEHNEIGYNYRMSNVLAALGRSQLARLPEIVTRRREIRDSYAKGFEPLSGISVANDPPWGYSNAWLSTILFHPDEYPFGSERARAGLDYANIESRPVWKPMHQQPVFAHSETYLTGIADAIFHQGLCLPSGGELSDHDLECVINIVLDSLKP